MTKEAYERLQEMCRICSKCVYIPPFDPATAECGQWNQTIEEMNRFGPDRDFVCTYYKDDQGRPNTRSSKSVEERLSTLEEVCLPPNDQIPKNQLWEYVEHFRAIRDQNDHKFEELAKNIEELKDYNLVQEELNEKEFALLNARYDRVRHSLSYIEGMVCSLAGRLEEAMAKKE